MAVLAAGSAPAQEALRNSLAVDQTLAPQNEVVNSGPDRPHLGPVQFSLNLYSSVELEDNINATEANPKSDAVLHNGFYTGLFWPATEQSDISLNAGIGYAHYLKYSQNDRLELAPNSALTWNLLLDDVTVALYDQFSYSQQVVTQGALSDLATFPVFDNTTGLRATWTPDQWLLSAGYSHDEYFSDLNSLAYLNRSSEYFFARGAWRFAENTQAGLEASASLTSYQIAVQSGNTSISVGPFVEWQITQAIHATLRGGPTFYLFDAQGSSSQSSVLNSYYLNLQLNQQLTDFVSHEFSLQREVSLGLNQGGNFLEQLTASYSLTWALTPRISLSASGTYEHGTQTFQSELIVAEGLAFLLNQTEVYDHYAVGPTVTWQATDKLSAKLSYNYYLRDSNLAGRGYRQNDLSLGLTYSF